MDKWKIGRENCEEERWRLDGDCGQKEKKKMKVKEKSKVGNKAPPNQAGN